MFDNAPILKFLIAVAVAVTATAQERPPLAEPDHPSVRPPVATMQTESLRLSRREAIDRALGQSPALLAAQAQVEQARAQIVVATALPDPTLAVDVAGQSNALNPGSGNASDQGIGLTFPFPGKTRLRRAVATADLRAAEFNLTQLRQQIASQAAQAYDALLVALRHRDDLRQNKDFATEFLQKTEARFKAGTVARVDVVKAQTDVASAENDLIANDRAVATAAATLNRVMGRMGGAPIEATDSLTVPASIAAVETLEQMAASNRPEIQTLAAQLEGARAATRLAGQYWRPDINLTLSRNAADGTPTTYTTGAGIGIPIFFWQHQHGEIAVAQHREEELTATLADIRAQVSLDVQSAYAAASTALRQAIFIRDELVPQASEVYRIASVSYGLGGSSALDLLDAKRTLLDAQRQYVDALGAANDAVAALELAVAAPLPQAPATGEPR